MILLAGIRGYIIMPKEVLPVVDIPVVTIIWTYTGLDTPEVEQRVTTYTEFSLSNNVNGIRNMVSAALQGVTITESLVLSPPTELADGSKVQVVNPQPQQEGVKRIAGR